MLFLWNTAIDLECKQAMYTKRPSGLIAMEFGPFRICGKTSRRPRHSSDLLVVISSPVLILVNKYVVWLSRAVNAVVALATMLGKRCPPAESLGSVLSLTSAKNIVLFHLNMIMVFALCVTTR